MPDVSVLIPACDAQRTIMACVQSVLEAGASVEVLVESDDGTDYAEVAGLPGVSVAVTGAVRSGVGAARNRALARARAEWVAYVDADDRVSPGYFADLLAARAPAVARTVVEEGVTLGEIAPACLDFPAMGREGASFRGIVPRAVCPVFVNDLSQDILHMAEVILRCGPMPVTRARYHLQLGTATVTAAGDFSARVEEAYLRHIARLLSGYGDHPGLEAAVAMFQAKRALNRQFTEQGAGRSYYAWVLGR